MSHPHCSRARSWGVARVACIAALVATLGISTSHAGPADVLSADGQWDKLFSDRPNNVGGTLLRDPLSDRILLFATYGPVWRLRLDEPSPWVQLPTPSPIGPSLNLVYDPIGHRVLSVVEGYWPDSIHIWQLPLGIAAGWSQLPTLHSPTSNWFGFSVAFDSLTNSITLFGGNSPNVGGGGTLIVNWTSVISLSSGTAVFTNQSTSGAPAPRTGHTMVVDRARRRMVVFGGIDRTSSFNDVKLGLLGPGGSWITPAISGTPPPPDGGYRAIYDPVRDRMVLLGNQSANGVWELTLSTPMTWTKLTPAGTTPDPSYPVVLVYDPDGDRMIVRSAEAIDDLWSLSLSGTPTWTSYTIPHPYGGSGRVVVGDANSDRMIVHGAVNQNDLWALALAAPFQWSQILPSGTPPPPRRYHAGVYDPQRDRMIIFGGKDPTGAWLNDVWALSLGASPTWSAIIPVGTPPSIRERHSAIYDPVRDRVIAFGGLGPSGDLNDVWELRLDSPVQWNLLAPTGAPPSPRHQMRSAYDPIRDRMLVAGGAGTSGFHELWALSLSGTPSWQPLFTTPSSDAAPVYDPVLDRFLFPVGATLWELSFPDPATPAWRQLAPTGQRPDAQGAVSIYDPLRDQVLCMPSTLNGDTYVLGFGSRVEVADGAESRVELRAGIPNPASHEAAFAVSIPKPSRIRLALYDVSGRLVRELIDAIVPAGRRTFAWDLRNGAGAHVEPGVYLCVLGSSNVRLVRRMVVVR